MIGHAEARQLLELIRWCRRGWHHGLLPRPIEISVRVLARVARLLHCVVASFGQPVPDVGRDPGGWLTVVDAAARYGVSHRTLTRWCATGQVRSVRIGAGSQAPYLIAAEELHRHLGERS